jgi:hypothetical protein
MRLPWGTLAEMRSIFLGHKDFAIVGCLSFEERCLAVPKRLRSGSCRWVDLLEIRSPEDAFPDYSTEAEARVESNRSKLGSIGVEFESSPAYLIATEDEMLHALDGYESREASETIVLDITSLPKRFFCFFLKRMLLRGAFRNVIATYTVPGSAGYATGHLAEDPMDYDYLPGFAGPLVPRGGTLVISVGFESLSIRSLLELYADRREATRIILPFPTGAGSMRRGWDTLKQMVSDAKYVNRNNVEAIAAWDAEQVYRTLDRWGEDSDGLTLAPFGPKPHSLGMALYAVKNDVGVYYTQPKSYSPDYTRGMGNTWAYVVKWAGVPCFDRRSNLV